MGTVVAAGTLVDRLYLPLLVTLVDRLECPFLVPCLVDSFALTLGLVVDLFEVLMVGSSAVRVETLDASLSCFRC